MRRDKLDSMTTEELQTLRVSIESDPANKAPTDSLYLYTPEARKRLEAIAREIQANVATKRAAAGEEVLMAGYTGRQTNRR